MSLSNVRSIRRVDEDATASPCAYCGMTADTADHVIPRARRGSVNPEWLVLVPDTVPACRECNSLAGDRICVPSVDEKRAAIQDLLRARYRKLLSMPDWTAGELDQLGPGLRRSVRAQLRERDTVIERLAWPALISEAYLNRFNEEAAA